MAQKIGNNWKGMGGSVPESEPEINPDKQDGATVKIGDGWRGMDPSVTPSDPEINPDKV